MMEISKRDWKVYRKNLPQWQEHYMEGLIKEYARIINDPAQPASDKFWELEKRIIKDRYHPGVIIEISRSTAIENIAYFYRKGMITIHDLEEFSDELQNVVHSLTER